MHLAEVASVGDWLKIPGWIGEPEWTDSQLRGAGRGISSARIFMINTRARSKVLHAWIMFVIVKQHLGE